MRHVVVVAVVTVAAAVIRANTYVSETVLSVLHIYIHLFLLQSHEVLELLCSLLRDEDEAQRDL